jgi:phosphate transport system permease protein
MIRAFSWFFSLFAAAAITLMIALFAWQSLPVWRHEGAGYITSARWFYRAHEFGALPMIYGSLVVALVALALAAPLGAGAAVFTAEYLPRPARLAVKTLIELLAGVPSVVYGLLGILLLRDWIYEAFEKWEPLSGDTLLTAGVLLAVMVLPTIVTLSEDALRSVPAAQRSAARALGLTRAEAIWSVSLPQARRGLAAALLLGFGRALGETIAVFLVVGRQDNNLPSPWWSPRPLLESGQTLTSKLGGSETNIGYGDPLHWGAMMGLGLLLLAITGGVTLLGMLRRRAGDA